MNDFLNKLMTNWKTSSAGIGMILTALAHIAHDYGAGCPINFVVDVPMLLGGLGLLAAKDSNVTGGTKSENNPPDTPQPKPLAPLPDNAIKKE